MTYRHLLLVRDPLDKSLFARMSILPQIIIHNVIHFEPIRPRLATLGEFSIELKPVLALMFESTLLRFAKLPSRVLRDVGPVLGGILIRRYFKDLVVTFVAVEIIVASLDIRGCVFLFNTAMPGADVTGSGCRWCSDRLKTCLTS
jgi:hypothetical protein